MNSVDDNTISIVQNYCTITIVLHRHQLPEARYNYDGPSEDAEKESVRTKGKGVRKEKTRSPKSI